MGNVLNCSKKPAHEAPEALRNFDKAAIPVFLMVGEDCTW